MTNNTVVLAVKKVSITQNIEAGLNHATVKLIPKPMNPICKV